MPPHPSGFRPVLCLSGWCYRRSRANETDSNQILNGEQKRNAVTGRPALCCAVLCSSCIRRNLLLPLLPPFPPPLRLRLTDCFTSSRQIPPRHHHHHPRRPTNFPRSREASRDAGFEARILGLAPRRLRVGVQSPRGSCSDSPGGAPRGMLYLKLPAGDLGFRPGAPRRGSGGGGA